MKHLLTESELLYSLQILKLFHAETDYRRIPIDAEKNTLDLIRQGRYEDFHASPYEKLKDNICPLIEPPLTNYIFMVVASITLYSRAAIEAGAVSDDVFDLSDTLLLQLAKCTSFEEVHNIYQLSGKFLAKLVHDSRQTNNNSKSWQLERILTYISQHIFQKITLDELAEYVSLSPGHISHLFSKEFGISVHNYIQREKTNVACNLLMHSDRPIAEIATYLGFASPSNFTVVFRKWQKMSPTEYRARMYREVY